MISNVIISFCCHWRTQIGEGGLIEGVGSESEIKKNKNKKIRKLTRPGLKNLMRYEKLNQN